MIAWCSARTVCCRSGEAAFVPVFLWVVARMAPVKILIHVVCLLAGLWTLQTYAEILLPVGLYTPEALR
jgi:hypothetical protein